jgi:hypothetical protein
VSYAIANPYLESPKAITYNVNKTTDGWRIEVAFPKHTTSTDKRIVLEWMQRYRAAIRRTHPLWVASFRVCENGYLLDIKPFTDLRHLPHEGERVKEIWNETLAYARC